VRDGDREAQNRILTNHEASYHIIDEKEVAEKGKSTVIPAGSTLNLGINSRTGTCDLELQLYVKRLRHVKFTFLLCSLL